MPDLSRPQRQSLVAILAELFGVRLLTQLGQGLLPLAVIAISTNALIVVPLALLAIATTITVAALRWWRTTFWVHHEELVVERGVFNRSRVQVPLDRIQQIATEQGVVQQVFGVRKVRVDAAGTTAAELTLSAVSDRVVAGLRELLVGADPVGDAPRPPGLPGDTGSTVPAPQPTTRVLHHGLGELVAVAIARPSAQALAGAAAAVGLLSAFVAPFLDRPATRSAGGFVVVLGIVVLGVLAATVVREFDLTVWRNDDGLRLTAGIVNKREMFARTERVQLIRRRRNLLEQLMGRTAVYFPQASSGKVAETATGGQANLFWIPGVRDGQVATLTDLFLPANRPALTEGIAPAAVRRWTLWAGVVPAVGVVACAGVAFVLDAPVAIPMGLMVGVIALLVGANLAARAQQARWRWVFGDGMLRTTNGLLAVASTDIAARKIQSVRLRQGWWHRRNRLATVECGTAGGTVVIPHLPDTTARNLRDDILHLVETDTGPWM